jgi:hypothetical protein
VAAIRLAGIGINNRDLLTTNILSELPFSSLLRRFLLKKESRFFGLGLAAEFVVALLE